MARRVRWIRENIDKKIRPSLLVDAGDTLYPTPEDPAQPLRERAILLLDLYREMGYDVMNVGARDLAASVAFLREETGKRGLLLVSANLFSKGKPAFKTHAVLKMGGLRVGVTGLAAPFLGKTPLAEGMETRDPAASLAQVLDRLRGKTDIVILLSNLGNEEDTKLARTAGIDVIVGSGPGARLTEPVRASNAYLLRPNEKGKSIGTATISLDGPGRQKTINGRLVLLTDAFQEDDDTRKRVEAFPPPAPPQAPRPVAPGIVPPPLAPPPR